MTDQATPRISIITATYNAASVLRHFMAAGAWLMLGIAASLRALNNEESGRA